MGFKNSLTLYKSIPSLPQDLTNLNMYEASLALDALSNFVTPELARDLANDVITLMTSVGGVGVMCLGGCSLFFARINFILSLFDRFYWNHSWCWCDVRAWWTGQSDCFSQGGLHLSLL